MTKVLRTIKPFHDCGSQEKLKKRPWGKEQLADAIKLLELDTDNINIKKILDIGFGATARSTLALADCFPDANITAIDNNAEALEAIHKLRKNPANQLPTNVKFYFGDPEFALPKEQKFDLIVLSMVFHCFDYPFRAIANLIEHSLAVKGYILFVHRTDPFMKAICNEQDDCIDGLPAAKAILQAWKSLGEHPASCCRFICDHTKFLAHFMEEAQFNCILDKPYSADAQEESVRDVLQQERYSPIEDKGGALIRLIDDSDKDLANAKIKLSLYLYQSTSSQPPIPAIGRYIEPIFIHSGILNIEDIREMESDYLNKNTQPESSIKRKTYYKEKIKNWFLKTGRFSEKDLKYGFYMDLRHEHSREPEGHETFRNQIWPEEVLYLPRPTGSFPLIHALNTLVIPKEESKLLQVLIWAYIPNMQYWYKNYHLMEEVLDFDDFGLCWQLLPYVKEEGKEENKFREVICQAFNQDDDPQWDPLVSYLTSLVKILREHNISNTYYFTYRDAYSNKKEPIAFAFQCTRWLNTKEALQLAIISQSALATINEGMSASYRLDKNKLDQIAENLNNLSAGLRPLRQLTESVEKIQEIIDPDKVFPGTNTLREFGLLLDTSLFQKSSNSHRPHHHLNNRVLLNLIKIENEKFSKVDEKLNDLLKNTCKDSDSTNLVKNFLNPMYAYQERGYRELPLSSICLAKSISRNFLPIAWILIALTEQDFPEKKSWQNYIEMGDMGSCLRLIKALRYIHNQLNLKCKLVHIEQDHNQNVYTISLLPEYNSYHQMQETVAPIIFRMNKKMPEGYLSKALFWLREDFEINFSELKNSKMPKNRKGLIGLGQDFILFQFKAIEYESN